MLQVGSKVKDFSLKDSKGMTHKLSNYLGKVVVIYIYPKNNTPGCNNQACSFRDNYHLYRENNIILLGISKDSQASHEKFNNKFKLTFPTLSDESLDVIKYFNAYAEKSMFGKKYMGVLRNTYIIDEEGVLIKVIKKASPDKNALEVIEFIKNR
ncbi:MAG TPA: peroxiredoxin [Acholeplasmataceae bacterium]|nr:peroxiredoxin [Acholeplasmataceae bacterium]